jgi:hypothetical protein
MALGGYLSVQTAKQILEQRIATERYEIEHEPEEERAELVSIYQNKGFTGPLLQHVVNHLTANPERWHRAMVHDELGVVEDTHSIRGWKAPRSGSPSCLVGSFRRCRNCSPCRRPGGGRMVSLRSLPWYLERSKPVTLDRVRCGTASNFLWSSPWERWPVWVWVCSCAGDECLLALVQA